MSSPTPSAFGMEVEMTHRQWTDTENDIIRENYPHKGAVFTTNILHDAGFSDRDALSVMKQASKLKVKRIRRTANYMLKQNIRFR